MREIYISKQKKWRRRWHPTLVLLPGKSHGRRSLEGCSPWGREESDTTEQLHFHFSLSCFEEGNGNPLQCSCLENPRDGGAWWAAVYQVAQSRTRLKRLSRSSSSSRTTHLVKILRHKMRPQYLKPQAHNLAKRINLMNAGSFISQFWYNLGASNKNLNDDDSKHLYVVV